ncbi:MAG: tetratricopeptide repeat protein [Acidobacteriota bacterium]|nr:tetratricopeptide repeat protein [Acidobacteriota bacterium]
MALKRSFTSCFAGLLVLVPLSLPAQSSSDPAQLAAQGQQALRHGQYAEAQSAFESLAKLEPGIAEIHATLGAIDYKLRDYEKAVHEIRTAKRLKPSLPRLDSLLGLSLAELGQFQEALPKLETGFKPTADEDTRRLCGLQLLRAYTSLGRDADAVQVALELNRIFPDDPEVLYHTGRIYGNFAYITMEKLHDSAPNSIWMLQAQGEANESQKNFDAAIDAFHHVLAIDPHRPGIHYRLGRIYLSRFHQSQNAADQEEARKEFAAELSIDPRNGNAGYELAVLDAEQGRPDEARRQFQSVLANFPDFEEALVGLAGVLLDQQKAAEALPILEHATHLRPDDEVAWYRLAQAYRAIGNRQEQATALAQFRKLHSSTPVAMRKPNQEEITPQKIETDKGGSSQN